MANLFSQFETVRTTVTIPINLIERAQHFIDQGTMPNRNALIVTAMSQLLARLEQLEIDRQFDAMANDADYLALNEQIADAFAKSDWQAFNDGERL